MATSASGKTSVSSYYTALESTSSLKTNACTSQSAPPDHIKACIKNVKRTVLEKYYGCGLCVPDLLEDCTVVDLGCGSGRDAYIISQLCGARGKVYGVDMTDAQLEVAREALEHHSQVEGSR